MPARIAQVLFPLNVDGPFDYRLSPDIQVPKGAYVYAPLGQQMRLGVVWDIIDDIEGRDLKEIAEVKRTKAVDASMLKFIDWVAKYNCASPGMVLRMMLRSHKALDPSKMMTKFKPSGSQTFKRTAARDRILSDGGPFPASASEIAERAQVSPGVVRGLESAGGLLAEMHPVDAPFATPNPDTCGIELTPSQAAAGAELAAQVAKEEFNVSLLDGVTGSGKTEVYFEAVAEVIRRGGQALILVPEIALTQAATKRFTRRFDAEPATWHSEMGDAARRRVWREVAQGRAKLVVGARSALFLPFPNLKVIVVDEEHDTSYKQEEGVIYNARDMAVVRGKTGGHAVVLASATPSLESLQNARSGRYAHLVLPERPGAITLPEIRLLDLKDHPPEKNHYMSPLLIESVHDILSRGEQALLYLNRRGFAPQIICRTCGEKLKSPDTDSWLVEHKATGRARCHHTGFSMPMPKACPSCGQDGTLVGVGPGVERVAEEAKTLFPDAKIEILSSDTAGNAENLRERMARMTEGDIDILVGTQMVVKGHNFPRLTFVGVVDGDLSLVGGDPRAGERTYQTLVQVAGRAGRADKPGHAIIQTHQPEHEALQALAAGNREQFVAAELSIRDMLGLPPYGRLAAVIVSGPDKFDTESLARKFVTLAPKTDGIDIFGPTDPPIARLRGLYRQRILIQASMSTNISAYMSAWQKRMKVPTRYKLHVDIDPQSFM